jgi:hypothetical protein
MPVETDGARIDSVPNEEMDEIVGNDPDDVYLTDA